MRTLRSLWGTTALSTLLSIHLVSCSSDDPGPGQDQDPAATVQTDIAEVDNSLTSFMQQFGVPGAALAVSVDEHMVYSKGYGTADLDSGAGVKKDDLFRIASISKVFTASAILKLVEEGELSLSDHIFGPQGIFGDELGAAQLSADHLAITVDHLLTHELGGWGTSSGGDPIDYATALERDAFIEYVLNDWPLQYAPGEAFSYSNMGYWLLARIIEQKSGKSYEEYVADLLSPIGITSFKTTSFREDDLEPNEVRYFGTENDAPYIYTIASRRDGDGGIVISAPDLLRFLCAIDGAPQRPDILSASSLDLMAQTTGLSNLGRGLAVWAQQDLLYFTGSLPGNRSWFMISNNGRTAVILLNYRRTDTQDFDNQLQSLLLDIVKDNSIPWQTNLDQF